MLKHAVNILMPYEKGLHFIFVRMNYKERQLLKKISHQFAEAFLDFKVPPTLPIYEMFNGYTDRPHPEFLLFVYANLS